MQIFTIHSTYAQFAVVRRFLTPEPAVAARRSTRSACQIAPSAGRASWRRRAVAAAGRTAAAAVAAASPSRCSRWAARTCCGSSGWRPYRWSGWACSTCSRARGRSWRSAGGSGGGKTRRRPSRSLARRRAASRWRRERTWCRAPWPPSVRCAPCWRVAATCPASGASCRRLGSARSAASPRRAEYGPRRPRRGVPPPCRSPRRPAWCSVRGGAGGWWAPSSWCRARPARRPSPRRRLSATVDVLPYQRRCYRSDCGLAGTASPGSSPAASTSVGCRRRRRRRATTGTGDWAAGSWASRRPTWWEAGRRRRSASRNWGSKCWGRRRAGSGRRRARRSTGVRWAARWGWRWRERCTTRPPSWRPQTGTSWRACATDAGCRRSGPSK